MKKNERLNELLRRCIVKAHEFYVQGDLERYGYWYQRATEYEEAQLAFDKKIEYRYKKVE